MTIEEMDADERRMQEVIDALRREGKEQTRREMENWTPSWVAILLADERRSDGRPR